MSTYEQGKSFRLGEGFSVHIRTLPKSSRRSGYEWFVYKGPFVNNEWYGSSEASTPAKAKAEAREALAYTLSRLSSRDPARPKRDPQFNASPLSGPRKDARDRAIDQAAAMARRTRTDYAVWMDSQGRFIVHLATAAPWKSTIAVAHAPMGHLSYKRYEGQERKIRRDPKREREAKAEMKTWKVYWAPEGRVIATVLAKDARAAIRKAPQPYRKYLGEMYAEEA